MSSAALQAQPHQTTTVGSHSPVAATSGRPYTGSSSQSRDGYYTQNSSNASPATTRRPSRRPSGNGATSTSNPQHYSPSGSNNTSAVTSRSTNQPASSPPTAYLNMAPGDHQRGIAPIVSPRTSSNRNPAQAAASTADRSRRTGHVESSHSPRATTGDGSQDRPDRQRSNGNTQQANGASEDPAVAAANAATRARRRAQAQDEAIPTRPSGTREPRSSASASAASAVQRQAMATAGSTGQYSDGLSREPSEVLNRVVISQPEVDIERERERMAEAIPSSPTSQRAPGSLSVVPSEGVDDGGRGGGRSRHDHSTSGREKSNAKFGDYFMGNTLGEGEFGKVKIGWKTKGDVEVSSYIRFSDCMLISFRLLSSSFAETVLVRTPPDLQRSTAKSPSSARYNILILYVYMRWWKLQNKLASSSNMPLAASSSIIFLTIDT